MAVFNKGSSFRQLMFYSQNIYIKCLLCADAGILLNVYKYSVLKNNPTRGWGAIIMTSLQIKKLRHEKNRVLATWWWQSWDLNLGCSTHCVPR